MVLVTFFAFLVAIIALTDSSAVTASSEYVFSTQALAKESLSQMREKPVSELCQEKVMRGLCEFDSKRRGNYLEMAEGSLGDADPKFISKVAAVFNNPEVCELIGAENELTKLFCFKLTAKINKDPNVCESITGNEFLKHKCFSDSYSELGDIDNCALISDRLQRALCSLRIENDAKACERVHRDQKNECLSKAAFLTESIELCEEITAEREKKNCKLIVSRVNSEDCSNLSVDIKDDCIMRNAFSKNDFEVCNSIIDKSKKELCQSVLVLRNKDIMGCNALDSREQRELCIFTFVKFMPMEDVHFLQCVKFGENETNKDWCKTLDSSYWDRQAGIIDKYLVQCGNLADSEDKAQCFGSVAHSSGQFEICTKITDAKKRNKCLSDIAMNSGNIKACDLVDDTYGKGDRNYCQLLVAVRIRDSEICDMLDESYHYKSHCYVTVAGLSGDMHICEKIPETELWGRSMRIMKDMCYEQVGKRNQKEEACGFIEDEYLRKNCFAVAKLDKELCKEIESEYNRNRCVTEIETIL